MKSFFFYFLSAVFLSYSSYAQNIVTIAGNGTAGYTGDNGPATAAELNFPEALAVDTAGNVYFADYSAHCVRKISAATGIITTVAGTGVAGYNGDNIAATSAMLQTPDGLALDDTGNLYIGDYNNARIRKINAGTGIITTIAGTGNPTYNGDNIAATAANMNPYGVKVDHAGNVYIADYDSYRVRKVTAGIITTIAGNGLGGFNGDGIPATAAHLGQVHNIALDDTGNVYITSIATHSVRKVSIATGLISTIAGTNTGGYNGDGIPATVAELNNPFGMTTDSLDNIYIADYGNTRIRKITASTGIISTVAGNGVSGYNGDNIPATNAELRLPRDVAISSSNMLYIADHSNHRIRKVSLAFFYASPSQTNVTCNGGSNGAASVAPVNGIAPYTYFWLPGGQTTASITGLTAGTYTCTVADAAGDTLHDTVVVTQPAAPQPPTIAITASPGTTVCPNTSVTFTATITNGGNAPAWQWMKNNINVGANSSTYIAASVSTGDVIRCVLTSSLPCLLVDTVGSNPLTMTVSGVTPIITITASGGNNICAADSVTFTATPANGGNAPAYQWKKNGSNVGANSPVYGATSWSNGDVVSCVLTSNASCTYVDTAVSNMISLLVLPASVPSITITASPGTTVAAGTTVTFMAAIANGGANPAWQWVKNGTDIGGANASSYVTNSLANNDVITCRLHSDRICAVPAIVTSNPLAMHITTGIGTMSSASTMLVYPNPNSGTFTIEQDGSNPSQTITLNIYDLSGRAVYKTTISKAKEEINAGNLAAGTYILQLTNEQGARQLQRLTIAR